MQTLAPVANYYIKTVQLCVQSLSYNKRKKPRNHILSDYILSQTFFSKPLVSVSIEVLLQAIVGPLLGASLIFGLHILFYA